MCARRARARRTSSRELRPKGEGGRPKGEGGIPKAAAPSAWPSALQWSLTGLRPLPAPTMEKQAAMTLESLPDEVSLLLLNFLNVRDWCRLAAVSRHWFRLANDKALWKRRAHVVKATGPSSRVCHSSLFCKCALSLPRPARTSVLLHCRFSARRNEYYIVFFPRSQPCSPLSRPLPFRAPFLPSPGLLPLPFRPIFIFFLPH